MGFSALFASIIFKKEIQCGLSPTADSTAVGIVGLTKHIQRRRENDVSIGAIVGAISESVLDRNSSRVSPADQADPL